MIGDILVWGFFSAFGWMAANWTADRIIPEKPKQEVQICTAWDEKDNGDGTKTRSRTCNFLKE